MSWDITPTTMVKCKPLISCMAMYGSGNNYHVNSDLHSAEHVMVNPRVAGLCIKGIGTGGFYSLLENLDGNHIMGIGQKLLLHIVTIFGKITRF